MSDEIIHVRDLVKAYISDSKTMKAGARSKWKYIVGDDLAGETIFRKLEKGVLTIGVRDQAVKALVMMKKTAIIERFREIFPDSDVREIRTGRLY